MALKEVHMILRLTLSRFVTKDLTEGLPEVGVAVEPQMVQVSELSAVRAVSVSHRGVIGVATDEGEVSSWRELEAGWTPSMDFGKVIPTIIYHQE